MTKAKKIGITLLIAVLAIQIACTSYYAGVYKQTYHKCVEVLEVCNDKLIICQGG